MRRRVHFAVVGVALATLAFGCSANEPQPADRTTAGERRGPDRDAPDRDDSDHRGDRDPKDDRARRETGFIAGTALSPSQLALVLDFANKALGSRYRFGGNNRRGFDCSGLTSFVFGKIGLDLPRTADQQARVGSWVPLDEARPGDLLFFAEDTTRERPPLTHVGLVVSSGGEPLTMIHASTSRGVVRTQIPSSRYWRERLRFARRIGD